MASAQTPRRARTIMSAMNIPSAVEANNQGLIGVRIKLHDPLVEKVIVPMAVEHYRRLDPRELEMHLSNSLLLTAIAGSLGDEHEVYQLPDDI